MSQFRRRVIALIPALVAMASCVFLSACLGDGDSAAREPEASTAKFRTLSLLAGPAERGGAGDRDGVGSKARFNRPTGLTVAPDGSIWVSQILSGKLKRISPAGDVRTVFDLSAQPARPVADGMSISYDVTGAVAAGPGGEAYLAVRQLTFPQPSAPDTASSAVDVRWAVWRVTAAGRVDPFVVPSLQGAGPQPAGPVATALAFNRRGELFIADTRCTIWRADGRGDAVLVHSSGPRGDGKPCTAGETFTQAITRMAFDPQDRLVYTTSGGELRRVEADGSATRIGNAPGVAFDCGAIAYTPSGKLIATDGSPQVYLGVPGRDPTAWVGSTTDRGWFDGSVADARFAKVCDVAVNAAGDTFVADQDGHTIRRISDTGVVSTVAGLALQSAWRDGQGAEARFSDDISLGTARDGSVWVADARNYVLRRVDQTGKVVTALGTHRSGLFISADGPIAGAKLARPSAVAEAVDGALWIGDLFSLRRLATDGVLSTRSVLPGGTMLAVIPDSTGNVLVLSGGYIVSVDGNAAAQSYYQFKRYAAHAPLDAAPVALEIRLAGDLAQQSSGFLPAGMCLARTGDLYFTLGRAVMRRGNDGAVVVHAGAVVTRGVADGPAAEARFNDPSGLACADDGSIFVADTGNHTVRRIGADRVVTTVLGRAGQAGHVFGSAPGGLDAPRSLALVPGGLVVSSGLGLVIARY